MINLFVRLLISGSLATMVGATALADGASIELTGPGSTNTITSSNFGSFMNSTRNWVAPSNWNSQYASSGPVSLGWNTEVGSYGGGLGSGNAYNYNSGQNNVEIVNAHSVPMVWGGGNNNGNGTIYLTGPYSTNRIYNNNSNRVSDTTTNNVTSTNYNNQTARSGGVTVTGNTVVEGVGGSGNAANVNSGTNSTYIQNSSPSLTGLGSYGGGNSALISTTGPGSYNAVGFNNSNSYRQNTQNTVNSANYNQQTATSGPVLISGNTLVTGVGGSGSAFNSNMGANNTSIANN